MSVGFQLCLILINGLGTIVSRLQLQCIVLVSKSAAFFLAKNKRKI